MLNIEFVPEEYRTAVRNNGDGFLTHNLYFESLSPNGNKGPKGFLKNQIDNDFGSFNSLCDGLTKAAMGQFGSGYAWLVYCNKKQCLKIKQTANQEIPMIDENTMKARSHTRGFRRVCRRSLNRCLIRIGIKRRMCYAKR